MDNFRENKFFALFFQKWDFGNLGIFVQASAKPSLLELCRAQPKNMNAVRNLCKSNAKKLASFAETPPKIMTQFVIFVQASAKPSLLELCRAQPKNMNAVRNLCKSNAKKLASFAETPPKIMTQFVICASERRAGVINKEAKYHQYTRIFDKKLRFYKK